MRQRSQKQKAGEPEGPPTNGMSGVMGNGPVFA